jgi:hypothetical protein
MQDVPPERRLDEGFGQECKTARKGRALNSGLTSHPIPAFSSLSQWCKHRPRRNRYQSPVCLHRRRLHRFQSRQRKMSVFSGTRRHSQFQSPWAINLVNCFSWTGPRSFRPCFRPKCRPTGEQGFHSGTNRNHKFFSTCPVDHTLIF